MNIKSALETALSTYVPEPCSRPFHLFMDRQIRPVIGATVGDEKLKNFSDISEKLFKEMLSSLSTVLEKEIPDSLPDACLTFSCGHWKRSEKFTLKVSLTTEVYLALTDRKIPTFSEQVHSEDDELKKRENNEHRCGKIREMFDSLEKNKGDIMPLDTGRNFCMAYHRKLNYPLMFVYKIDEKKEIITSFSSAEIFAALRELEGFVRNCKSLHDLFCISMTITPSYNYQAVAVIEEGAFAAFTNKKGEAVKEDWGFKHTAQKGIGQAEALDLIVHACRSAHSSNVRNSIYHSRNSCLKTTVTVFFVAA